MKANCSSRIFDQQSICACGEVSSLPLYWPLLSIVEIRSAFPIAITYKYRKTDREKKRKEKQKHILNILRHFVLYATRSRMDRRGERRRRKSWADTDKSCEAHLQESSTLAASGSRTELELERGFKGGRLQGKQCGLGLAILKHVAKCSRRGLRLALKWVQHWLWGSLSRCLTACHRQALRQTSNLK